MECIDALNLPYKRRYRTSEFGSKKHLSDKATNRELRNIPILAVFRESRQCPCLTGLLDFLRINFLSVRAAICVAFDAALSVTRKCELTDV
jgi:hypothetical protein